jgi:hypothetical protein
MVLIEELEQYCYINNIFIDNEYSKEYFNLWHYAFNRSFYQLDNQYYEHHHFIPESMDGTEEQYNYIILTLSEHFRAHQLLVKITEGKNKGKMWNALWKMMNTRKGVIFTPAEYKEAKEELSKENSIRLKELASTGEHQWQQPENRKKNADRLKELALCGKHPLQTIENRKIKSDLQMVKISNGTHPFLNPDLIKENSIKMKELASRSELKLQSPEIRRMNSERLIRLAADGKHNSQSPDARAKASERENNKIQEGTHIFLDIEFRKKNSEKLKGRIFSEETRQKLSIKHEKTYKITLPDGRIEIIKGAKNVASRLNVSVCTVFRYIKQNDIIKIGKLTGFYLSLYDNEI